MEFPRRRRYEETSGDQHVVPNAHLGMRAALFARAWRAAPAEARRQEFAERLGENTGKLQLEECGPIGLGGGEIATEIATLVGQQQRPAQVWANE